MKKQQTYYAHTLPDCPPSQWEKLEDHLKLVAEGDGKDFPGAQGFAEAFGAGDWGQLLGWWHDLGKYSASFQDYLKQAGANSADGHFAEVHGKVDHSTAGAQHAVGRCEKIGRLIAYALAGHHAGLPDSGHDRAELDQRLKKTIEPWESAAPASVKDQPCPASPTLNLDSNERYRSFQIAMFCRMLFSCLVDADFLATEQFMRPDQAALRPTQQPDMTMLLERLNKYIDALQVTADQTPVNQKRSEVLAACRAKAQFAPGLFSLMVPTGGGKTLSSLAFALEHAVNYKMRRVIYAAPFTSIIEQNADVFRKVFGDLADTTVLEHHSNLDPDDPKKQNECSRLASENWDAPVIVTTNVQFFESLFAYRTSRCRKLHAIAGSVIILDEAQALPPELLKPTLAAIDELARNYNCTIILCTATQPAIEKSGEFCIGLENVRPIIDKPQLLHNALKRVDVQTIGKLEDHELVEHLSNQPAALCIVNTKKHAAELFAMLQEQTDSNSCFHLSAHMCPAHRSDILAEIRLCLNAKQPCRLISTQLIEAGVDIDFPVVYRAMAGLDSIAQAAGRCNREGRLADKDGKPRHGRVFIFETEKRPQFLAATMDAALQILPDHKSDLLSPQAVRSYFEQFYWKQGQENGAGWDKKDVMQCFDKFGKYLQFREAANNYKFIDDVQTPLIVPYGKKGNSLVHDLLAMDEPPGWKFLRNAQRYSVNLYSDQITQLRKNAALLERDSEAWIKTRHNLLLGNRAAYDDNLGLRLDIAGLGEMVV